MTGTRFSSAILAATAHHEAGQHRIAADPHRARGSRDHSHPTSVWAALGCLKIKVAGHPLNAACHSDTLPAQKALAAKV